MPSARKASAWLSAAALLAFVSAESEARAPALETREFRVPAQDAGIELLVRNEYNRPLTGPLQQPVVLFVHGASFPASSTFGVALSARSWMTLFAASGFDAWSLDIRGYGGSTRPVAMSQPPEANPPFAGAREAVRDIAAAVDFILERRKLERLTLVGWSWGTTTTAAFAAEHPEKVERLVLLSPVWLGVRQQQYQGAYRTSTYESARAFAIAGLPKERVGEISPLGNFDAWWAATLATDPEGAARSPPVVRSPNGAMQDFAEAWSAGKSTYDPGKIRAPTLLIVGEWDTITPPSMAQGLYDKLTNARERRLIKFSEGTHFMIIEKHYQLLIREVTDFLADP